MLALDSRRSTPSAKRAIEVYRQHRSLPVSGWLFLVNRALVVQPLVQRFERGEAAGRSVLVLRPICALSAATFVGDPVAKGVISSLDHVHHLHQVARIVVVAPYLASAAFWFSSLSPWGSF
jgi:hypothetical protein